MLVRTFDSFLNMCQLPNSNSPGIVESFVVQKKGITAGLCLYVLIFFFLNIFTKALMQ